MPPVSTLYSALIAIGVPQGRFLRRLFQRGKVRLGQETVRDADRPYDVPELVGRTLWVDGRKIVLDRPTLEAAGLLG